MNQIYKPMAQTDEQKLERGRDIWDMTQTKGWQILSGSIAEEIQLETAELLDCPIKDDLEHKQLIKAYKKVLRMVESAIADRDEAAQNLRGE